MSKVERPPGFVYAFAKLGGAIEELVGAGDIKERLRAAAMILAPIFPDDFPEPLRGEYASLHEALTWVPPEAGSSQGLLGATIDAMSEDEAAELATRLLLVYMDAAEIYYRR